MQTHNTLLEGRHSTLPTPGGGGGGVETKEVPTHPPTTKTNMTVEGWSEAVHDFGNLCKPATQCHNTMSSIECIVIQCSTHNQPCLKTTSEDRD